MAKKSSRRGSKKGNTVKVGNLSEVSSGFKVIPEGVYQVTLTEAEAGESKNDKPKIDFTFEIAEGKNKGSKLFHTCSLQPQALFSIKALLEALGFDIPTDEFELDINDLIGLECNVEVAHETYEGKKKSRIVEFINPEDDSEDDDSDDDDVDVEEVLKGLDIDDLKEVCDELDIKYKSKDKESALIKKIMGEDEEDITEALEELDLLEDSDDGDDDSDDDDDYEDWDLKDLQAECKERGIKFNKKKDKKPALIELLEEDDEE